MPRDQRSVPACLALFVTAPLVAEFLLGNMSLRMLPTLVVLAPMYGGGALLIRESARRAQRGWPTMLVFGAAYALVEEGFGTQSLFNPNYLRLNLHLLDHAFVPALGIGAWWTLFMFNLHTFWSIAVSIALVEAVVPTRAGKPWLGAMGDTVTALLYLLGCSATCRFTLRSEHFLASTPQLLATAACVLALIALAFLLPKAQPSTAAGNVPEAWLTGSVALVLGLAVLLVPPGWNWGAAAALAAIDLTFLVCVARYSPRSPWSPLHTLSLAAGGALAYGLHAFLQPPSVGAQGPIAKAGNLLFLIAALALIAAGARKSSLAGRQPAYS